jgi:hypothetical protein
VPLLPRAPRPHHTSIDDQVRRTILVKGADANVSEEQLLELYREEGCYPDICTLIEEIADRYGLDLDGLLKHHAHGPVMELYQRIVNPSENDRQRAPIRRIAITKLERESPASLLYMLPDPEFLTALEMRQPPSRSLALPISPTRSS